jgi:hypothetical protein
MLLLHGEENLERFRSETACAVYQLPWLSPRDAMNYSGELTELVPLFEKPLQSLHEALVPRQSRQQHRLSAASTRRNRHSSSPAL